MIHLALCVWSHGFLGEVKEGSFYFIENAGDQYNKYGKMVSVLRNDFDKRDLLLLERFQIKQTFTEIPPLLTLVTSIY